MAPAFSQVQSKRKELSHVQKELESTRQEIEEYKRLEQSLGRELERLEGRNAEARKRMAQLQRGIRLAQEKRAQLKGRLGALGQASGFWRETLESELRRLAQAQASRNESFASLDLWGEFFRREAILEKARMLSGLQGLGRRTAQAELETRRRAEELLGKSQQAQAEAESRQREYQQKQAAIAEAQEKRTAAQQRAQELEESAKALTRLIRMLGRQKGYHKAASAGLERPKNSLPWPADGSVSRPFGRQLNPELNTWVIHQGILLETKPGAPVSAVEDGRVIFSGPFRSYGQVLILDHGSNFFSIYGELGEILKSKGAEVRAGDAIATAGHASPARGGSLYLELRRGAEALDPMAWLQKR